MFKIAPAAFPCAAFRRSGGVAADAVDHDEIDLDLVFYGLVHDFGRVLDHLRIQHVWDHFVEREGLGVGFLVAHPEGSD